MIVSYQNRFIDIWLFNAEHQARSVVGQAYYLGFAAFFAWIVVSGQDCTASGACRGLGIFSFFLGYLLLFAVQLVFNALFLYSPDNRTLFTDHRVELREDGLQEETRYWQSLFRWHGIRRVISMRSVTAIYISGQAAILIPSRAFPDRAQRTAFVRAVQDRVRSSRQADQAGGPAA
jgi:hypothetical protein